MGKGSDDMIEISKARFEALAAYCRHPATLRDAEELRWFNAAEGDIAATVIRDRTDDDFAGIILARDEKEKFRFVGITDFVKSSGQACDLLRNKISELLPHLEEERKQGDVKGKPVDFFAPVAKTKQPLHPAFVSLTELEGYSPARSIIEPMMRWYEDTDGNFIEQFQTTGFDARIWELYLFAVITEAGFAIDRTSAVPDFTCWGLRGEFCVEATTVNPSPDSSVMSLPRAKNEQEMLAVLRDYLPIKFSGPLTTKLDKRYWEKPNAKGKPLVFAIQDFHAPMSMTYSRGALPTYLYGYEYEAVFESNGTLRIVPKEVTSHEWNGKIVPSGFFKLERSENVSAVIFNANATISKFNRMGMLTGFGSKRVRMSRSGIAVDLDPNASEPVAFELDVNDPEYQENWIEGMDVYHNPWAKYPLSEHMLPGAAHHHLRKDGQIFSNIPEWQPLSSTTSIYVDKGN